MPKTGFEKSILLLEELSTKLLSAHNKEVDDLREDNEDLVKVSQVKKLEKQLSSLQKENERLQKRLNKLEPSSNDVDDENNDDDDDEQPSKSKNKSTKKSTKKSTTKSFSFVESSITLLSKISEFCVEKF